MRRPRLAPSHPAGWRTAARATLLLAALLTCAAGGLWLYAGERSTARQQAENRRAELQAQLKGALSQEASLPALHRQEGELAMRLAAAEENLWPDGTDAARLLQAKLARRAEECGVSMDTFHPLAAPEKMADAPGAEISLRGDYAQLLRFTELVTAAPWPVLLDTMEIVRDEREGQSAPEGAAALRMNARLRIMARGSKTIDEEENR